MGSSLTITDTYIPGLWMAAWLSTGLHSDVLSEIVGVNYGSEPKDLDLLRKLGGPYGHTIAKMIIVQRGIDLSKYGGKQLCSNVEM
jgi:hypothetical protein